MTPRLARIAPWLLRGAVILSVGWIATVLLLIWQSGKDDTRLAIVQGQRFIIHIADGTIEGKRPVLTDPQEETKAEENLIEAAPEEAEAATGAVGKIRAASNPIPNPSQDLLEKTKGVTLPKIAASGAKPWQFYGHSFRRQNEFPLIAIIITGLGHNEEEMELAAALDDRVGLGLSPYAAHIPSWAAAARLSGHEFYVELPMQSFGYPNDDPGPYALLLSHSTDSNTKNLYWAMSRIQGYVGVIAPPSEVITNSTDTLNLLRAELAPRGLMLLSMRDSAIPEPSEPMQPALVAMNADMWLDEELSEMSIQARLASLEQVAQRNGFAIGMARSYPLSIKVVDHWIQTLGERNMVLAPASFIGKLRYP